MAINEEKMIKAIENYRRWRPFLGWFWLAYFVAVGLWVLLMIMLDTMLSAVNRI
jgi:hypothetical protein